MAYTGTIIDGDQSSHMIVPLAVINRHSAVRYGLSFSLGIDYLSSSNWGFNQCLKKIKKRLFNQREFQPSSHISIFTYSIGGSDHAIEGFQPQSES